MFSLSCKQGAGICKAWLGVLDGLRGPETVVLTISLEHFPQYVVGTFVTKVGLVFHFG